MQDRRGTNGSHGSDLWKGLYDKPVEGEVRQWLEFIELQCEEYFPSEWPQ